MRLLMDCLDKTGKKYTYQAGMASLNYSFYPVEKGFTITLFGFNDKLFVLFQKILENIELFEARFDESIFQDVHDEFKRSDYNHFITSTGLANDLSYNLKKNINWL